MKKISKFGVKLIKSISFFRFNGIVIISAIVSCLVLFASAESIQGNEYVTRATGLIWDDPEVISSHLVNTEPSTWSANRDPAYDEPYYVLGDMDDDFRITAADARTILRASARLETLDPAHGRTADVNGDGDLNAADARITLRVSAKLQHFNINVKCGLNETYTADWLSVPSNMYQWKVSCVPSDGISVKENVIMPDHPEYLGGAYRKTFDFTPDTAGTYKIVFTCDGIPGAEPDVSDKIELTITAGTNG